MRVAPAAITADLFSGAGGLSLGQAGFRTVVGVDHYTEAVETHRHRFPRLSLDWDLGDVSRVEELAGCLYAIGVDLTPAGRPANPSQRPAAPASVTRCETGCETRTTSGVTYGVPSSRSYAWYCPAPS